MVPEAWYVALSVVLFAIGVTGVLIRRNPLVVFMSIELMLNAAPGARPRRPSQRRRLSVDDLSLMRW